MIIGKSISAISSEYRGGNVTILDPLCPLNQDFDQLVVFLKGCATLCLASRLGLLIKWAHVVEKQMRGNYGPVLTIALQGTK